MNKSVILLNITKLRNINQFHHNPSFSYSYLSLPLPQTGFLRPEKHERHAQADRRSDLIKSFLWPALMQNTHCVFKAIVVT